MIALEQVPVEEQSAATSSLIVDVPHASLAIPDDVWPEFLVTQATVEAEAVASADLYSGEMARQAWHARCTVGALVRVPTVQ